MQRLDLSGQLFGRLRAIQFSHIDGNKKSHWLCRCDCGNECTVQLGNLRCGHTQSCGCLQKEQTHKSNIVNIVGQRFGRLLVLEYAYSKNFSSFWLCQCDCGNKKIILCDQLKSGDTLSCGCLNRELVSKRMSLENHPNWRGGTSKQTYPSEWTNKLKELIRNRDYRKCQYPDCNYDDTKETQKLHVHHIDGNKQNCQEYNLISLCNNHHQKIEHNNPENWIDYFYQITGDFYGS